MIHQTPFVIVDTETTGLEPRLDALVEVAAVKMLNGEIIDEWDTLVNPGVFIPQETTDITGITTEMVKDAPWFKDVADDYLKFLGDDSVFVAHNAEFDRAFLNIHLGRLEKPVMANPYLCTFRLAKQVHPNLKKYGLGELASIFDIELNNAHRAIHDARATAYLFSKFMRVLQDGGLKHLKDIPHIQNLPVEEEEKLDGQVSLF
jgi:DNA polymerase III epsilon subunit family exonuclease